MNEEDQRELVWAETDYNLSRSRVAEAQRMLDLHKKQMNEAANELTAAMIKAGLTEYGPITSELVWNERQQEHRRVWRIRDDT